MGILSEGPGKIEDPAKTGGLWAEEGARREVREVGSGQLRFCGHASGAIGDIGIPGSGDKAYLPAFR
jgi:hypothetical protein